MPSDAFMGNNAEILLKSHVAEVCALVSVTAQANDLGSVLEVTTSCNVPSFALEFSGVGALNLRQARHVSDQGWVSASEDTVFIKANRLGAHVISVELGNAIADLDGLDVSILTL